IKQEGEFLVTEHGVEGNLVYALSAPLRDTIETAGSATLGIDLAPGRDLQRLTQDLAHPRGRDSLANHLRRRAGITGVKAALLHEYATPFDLAAPERLAAILKSLPLRLDSPRPLDEAISSAGGIDFAALDENLMLRAVPGTYCAGEMLDWEAPTGGYLLTACFASGRAAGLGVLRWLRPAMDPPQPIM
nr:NAD(P)/FAD-dependent oxidoreductase [Sulfuritalea sp.]